MISKGRKVKVRAWKKRRRSLSLSRFTLCNCCRVNTSLPHYHTDLYDIIIFTPLRGRVRPHQAYKVSYVLLVVGVVVVVVVVPGQIF